MADWAAKRFWKDTTADSVDGGFAVHLDGRAIKTPGKQSLIVPTMAMAEAMAHEWDAQDGKIDPDTMPVTKSANSAVDKVGVQFADVADMLAEYGETDLLCYRAAAPEGLAQKQAEAWDPLLDWARTRFDAPMTAHVGVMFAPQPEASMQNLRRAVHGFDAFALTGVHDLIGLSGSLILGLAATDDFMSPDTLWDLSRIDEEWQIAQWGRDEEADAMAEVKKQAFLHAKRFYELSLTSAK